MVKNYIRMIYIYIYIYIEIIIRFILFFINRGKFGLLLFAWRAI